VVELDPTGATVLNTWTGFTAADGIAVDKAGDIYVSQLLAPEANPPAPQIAGVVTEIPTSGSDINTDVPFPSGLVLDKAGNLYVSAFSIAPSRGLGFPGTSGEVLRLTAGSSD
jgi:sugar lactone lactonase YvrE